MVLGRIFWHFSLFWPKTSLSIYFYNVNSSKASFLQLLTRFQVIIIKLLDFYILIFFWFSIGWNINFYKKCDFYLVWESTYFDTDWIQTHESTFKVESIKLNCIYCKKCFNDYSRMATTCQQCFLLTPVSLFI